MINTQFKKENIFKTILISIIFGGILFFSDVHIINAVWNCSSPYNTAAYDYVKTNGRQDRAECVRGRSGCDNPGDWSDECSDPCTNPSGCGSCEGRCIGDQLYYADIWDDDSSEDGVRIKSRTCRNLTVGRTSACFPVASIDSPGSNVSFTHGDNISFEGSGTDPNDDDINGYVWRIRTVANNNAGNYLDDVFIYEGNFNKNNLPVNEYIIFLKVIDEVNAHSDYVWKRLSVTERVVPIRGACAENSPYEYESIIDSWPSTLNLYFCEEGTRTSLPSFPVQGGSVTWGCNGNSTGTSTAADACSASRELPPRVDGVCLDSPIELSVGDESWVGAEVISFCETGTPSSNLPTFPAYGQTAKWTCIGLGPEHEDTEIDACSAIREKPEATCGTQIEHSTDVTPSGELYTLCTTGSTEVATPFFRTDGNWEWTCKHDISAADPLEIKCETPSCLAGTPIEFQRYVYLERGGGVNSASVIVTCPNVCCVIQREGTEGNKQIDVAGQAESNEVICTDDVGQIQIPPGGIDLVADCWFDGDDRTNDGELTVENIGSFRIDTMCTARECNAGGTCQATPQAAINLNECKSSCNSNVDCSSGSMIETRP